jgi:hypothetical protein
MAKEIHAQTVASILAKTTDEEILAIIPTLYWNERPDRYVPFLKKLRTIEPKATVMTCRLKRAYSQDEKRQTIINVVGVQDGDPTEWAIEFRPWAEWLSMVIDCPPEFELSDTQILANIFYEMTFAGFDEEEVEIKLNEIEEIAETRRK